MPARSASRPCSPNAPVTIFSLDAEGVYTFSAGSVPPLLGLRHADRIGKSLSSLYASMPDHVSAARRALAGETLTSHGRTDQGWFESRWSPLRTADGKPAGTIGVVIDITPQKRAEQALADREARFRALTEHSGDLVCVVDAQARVTYESPAFARLLGRSLSDFQADDVFGLVHPDDRALLAGALQGVVVEGKSARPGLVPRDRRRGELAYDRDARGEQTGGSAGRRHHCHEQRYQSTEGSRDGACRERGTPA